MLRNSTQLQALFEERRRIKANQQKQLKQKKAKENKLKNKEYQRTYYYLQKQLKQEAKRIKIRELQELANTINKKPQQDIKITSTTYTVYNNPTRERDIKETDIYTKYELEHIEELYPQEEGRINWDFFYELVEKIKNKLKTL